MWLLTCLPLTGMAFSSVRHVPLLALWAAPVLALLAQTAADRWAEARVWQTGWLTASGMIGVPTLLVSGRHDEATPALQETLREGISGSEWICFEESSHMPHVEERERYMKVVGDWLARHD